MAASASGLRVLVIDEQSVTRRMAAKMVRDGGATEVLEAEGVEHALVLLDAQQLPVDLVITDIKAGASSGSMDAVAFVRRIAERRLAAHLIIASALEEPIIRAVEAMANGFGLDVAGLVRRPISPETLRPVIVRLVARRAAAPLLRSRSVHLTVEDLRHAIADKQFVPYFQPRVRASDGSVTAAEALIRWAHPERGLVPPGAFIPLADRTGLIDGITDVVLEKSINWARVWRDAGIDIAVSVNLTENALNQPRLPERIAQLARQHDVAHGRIVLEVTESAAITDKASSLEALARLRIMGFGLSIDDFGTGMGTPEQLARTPFTEVKIDQALVTGVCEQPQFFGVLEYSLKLAKQLNLKTVAEGVETQADWDLLNDLGCDEMQGYHVARPMPGEEIEGWAKGWHREAL
ncbi:EAL domain-containing protein [Dongia mobilis]|jgi:EAL domain-containing protein (putative c-di-GMP-specific phosphodiesterase class I)|uniref:EAL domain-containing response regulator n=1 Tax=Dongia sp. TaxID=1977262 RepID=UPI0026F2119B